MLSDYLFILVILVVGVAFPLGAIVNSWVFGQLRIRPERYDANKAKTYECGFDTIGPSWIQFNFRYYAYALLFVVFDIETVFLYPWAVHLRQLGLFGLIEMAVFMAILALGLVYAWKKGALRWA